jgi:hypothetical protein
MLLGKSLRSPVTGEPGGVFPWHPMALTVEIEILGQAVLSDLNPLVISHVVLHGSSSECYADNQDRSIVAVENRAAE